MRHISGPTPNYGEMGAEGEPALVTRPARSTGRRPAITQRYAWRLARWNGWGLVGNSNSETSVAFLKQLKDKHPGPLKVIWDNAPVHRGEALREYLRTPELDLRLVNLPGYNPDFNADEAIWGWAREEATGNLCLGTREAVQERFDSFLAGLANRQDEVRRRCRTILQSRTEALLRDRLPDLHHPTIAHPTLVLV